MQCDLCDGRRTLSPDKISSCTKCGGAGWITESVQTGFVKVEKRAVCPKCHGTRFQISEPCPACKGTGKTKRTFASNIVIPKGVPDGAIIVRLSFPFSLFQSIDRLID